ncbi:hypothetical protein BX666DRAFT_1991398 [Dichotomocladium elegans]|nr:hypothetical protein BX666DRAFT_1991398 [Dichotomocladium elegans]
MSIFPKNGVTRGKCISSNTNVPAESSLRRLKATEVLVIASHGRIYAVHKRDGHRLWRRPFPASSMGTAISLFITDQERLIAASNGKTVAMDLFTGETLWINKMKGCGYAEVGTVVTPSRPLRPVCSDATEQGPPAYSQKIPQADDDSNSHSPVIVACTEGKCIGLDLHTGEGNVHPLSIFKKKREREMLIRKSCICITELWLFECLNGDLLLPIALISPASEYYKAPDVYVVCGSMLYCLEARTGKLQWYTQFSNTKMGNGHTTMATLWSSRTAAETATPFAMFPVAQQAAESRQRGKDG